MFNMPIITKGFVGSTDTKSSVYVTTYTSLRTEVLKGEKLIIISPDMDQKRALEISARLLETLDMP